MKMAKPEDVSVTEGKKICKSEIVPSRARWPARLLGAMIVVSGLSVAQAREGAATVSKPVAGAIVSCDEKRRCAEANVEDEPAITENSRGAIRRDAGGACKASLAGKIASWVMVGLVVFWFGGSFLIDSIYHAVTGKWLWFGEFFEDKKDNSRSPPQD
jgi:hypothetical protein